MNLRIPPVTLNLIIINVLVYIAHLTVFPHWLNEMLPAYYPTHEKFFPPVGIATHMFMHGSNMHLFFNMFGLFMFGPPLEQRWGPKRFLSFYLIAAFGALALHFFVIFLQGNGELAKGVVGASGALFGLLAGYGTLFPNNKILLLIPPIPIKAKYFVLIYGALELYLGLQNFSGDNIAHFAHLGGALFGFLLIQFWKRRDGYV